MHALTRLALLALAPALLPTAAQAGEASPPHIVAAVSFGTLGVGPEVTFRANRAIGVRASATWLGVSHGVTDANIAYQGHLKLASYGVMADLYPFGGHFRVSAGVRRNRNRLPLTATPTGPVTIGANTYTPAQVGTLAGTVRVNEWSPMLTVGYAGGLSKGVKLGFDVGALYQDTPTVSDLASTSALVTPADLASEQQTINAKLHKYRFYPVAQMWLGYAF